MPDPQSMAVHTGDIRGHAQHVGEIQRTTTTAVDAVHQVTPGGWDNAYGVICQFFPAGLHPIADFTGQVIQNLSDALSHVAGELNNAAADYDGIDQNATDQHQKILDELNNAPRPTIHGQIR